MAIEYAHRTVRHIRPRPQEVHTTSQGLKVGLYTPTILGGNSYAGFMTGGQ